MNDGRDIFEEPFKKSSRNFDLSKSEGGNYKDSDMRQRWRLFSKGFKAGQESMSLSINLQNQEQLR
jgi:hypothetical protein